MRNTAKKPTGARVDLPREEYEALCYLRDVTYAGELAKYERVVEQLNMCSKADKHLINEQSITLDHLRLKNLQQHTLILKMQKRLEELEPVKIETQQPAFARKR